MISIDFILRVIWLAVFILRLSCCYFYVNKIHSILFKFKTILAVVINKLVKQLDFQCSNQASNALGTYGNQNDIMQNILCGCRLLTADNCVLFDICNAISFIENNRKSVPRSFFQAYNLISKTPSSKRCTQCQFQYKIFVLVYKVYMTYGAYCLGVILLYISHEPEINTLLTIHQTLKMWWLFCCAKRKIINV